MKPLTAEGVERILKENGYELSRVKGSHFIWKNTAKGHAVPVPHHGNAPIPQGTLNSIFRACGIERPQR